MTPNVIYERIVRPSSLLLYEGRFYTEKGFAPVSKAGSDEQVINIILPVLSFFHIKTHCLTQSNRHRNVHI